MTPYRYEVHIDGEDDPIFTNVVTFSDTGLCKIVLTPGQTLIVAIARVRIIDRGAPK